MKILIKEMCTLEDLLKFTGGKRICSSVDPHADEAKQKFVSFFKKALYFYLITLAHFYPFHSFFAGKLRHTQF